MINLASTSDKLYAVTDAAGDVECHASWVDLNGTTVTPGRQNTASITTATSTDVVVAPGSSTVRNVKFLAIFNASASVTNTVSVFHTDGTNPVELVSMLLGNSYSYAPRWWFVSPQEIERVDVSYGAHSAAYAGNAAGVVMVMKSRMPATSTG